MVIHFNVCHLGFSELPVFYVKFDNEDGKCVEGYKIIINHIMWMIFLQW